MKKIELKGHTGPCARFMGTYTRRSQDVNGRPSYEMAAIGTKYYMFRTRNEGSITASFRECWFVSDIEPPAVTGSANHRPFVSSRGKSESPTGGLRFSKAAPPPGYSVPRHPANLRTR